MNKFLFTLVPIIIGFIMFATIGAVIVVFYWAANTSVEDIASGAGRAVAAFNKEANK